jgi:hypothetical protein
VGNVEIFGIGLKLLPSLHKIIGAVMVAARSITGNEHCVHLDGFLKLASHTPLLEHLQGRKRFHYFQKRFGAFSQLKSPGAPGHRASILPSSESARGSRDTSKWASLSLLAGDFTIERSLGIERTNQGKSTKATH